MSTPQGASKVLATTMVESFFERMKAEARTKGGHFLYGTAGKNWPGPRAGT